MLDVRGGGMTLNLFSPEDGPYRQIPAQDLYYPLELQKGYRQWGPFVFSAIYVCGVRHRLIGFGRFVILIVDRS